MSVQTYTTVGNGTWICPDYIYSVAVECWGAGGGGGNVASGASNAAAGGGGGGAYSYKVFTVVPGVAYSLSVGSGGSQSVNGTDTWFSSSGLMLAAGGRSSTGTIAGGVGGPSGSCIGDVIYAGGAAGNGLNASGGGGGGAAAWASGVGSVGSNSNAAGQGAGGAASGDGGAGGAGRFNAQGAGNGSGGYVPGGGGGGAWRSANTGPYTGGAGGAGQVKFTYTAGGALMAQVQSRYTKKANGASVGGDNYLGTTVAGGGTVAGTTKNNGGVIIRGGTITSSLWTSKAVTYSNSPMGVIVYLSDSTNVPLVDGLFTPRNVTFKAVASGNFATMTAGSYVARRLTTTLAGVANTVLRSGGASYGIRRSIHFAQSYRSKFMYKIAYERMALTSGDLTDGTPHPEQTYLAYYSNTNLTTAKKNVFGQNSATATNPASQGVAQSGDVSAFPSLAIPGQLIYKGPAPLPKLDVYKAKTQG